MDELDKISYLALNMNPAVCIKCKGRFVRPEDWDNVDFNAMIILCECPNCGSRYNLIMSLEQAEIWDDDLCSQMDSMEIDAERLRLTDELVASVGS